LTPTRSYEEIILQACGFPGSSSSSSMHACWMSMPSPYSSATSLRPALQELQRHVCSALSIITSHLSAATAAALLGRL
jgi:hypothetical protein